MDLSVQPVLARDGSSVPVDGSSNVAGVYSKPVNGSLAMVTVAVAGSSKNVQGSTVAVGGSTVAVGGNSKNLRGSTVAVGGRTVAVGGSTVAVGGSSKDVGDSPLAADSRLVSIASSLVNADGISTMGERPDEHYCSLGDNSNHSDASVSDNGSHGEASFSDDANHGDPRAPDGGETKSLDGVGETNTEVKHEGSSNNCAEAGSKYPAVGGAATTPAGGTPFKLTLKCYSNNLDGKIKKTDVKKEVNYVPVQRSEEVSRDADSENEVNYVPVQTSEEVSHDSDSDSSFALDSLEIASAFPENIRKEGAHFIDNLKHPSSSSANTAVLKAETKDVVNRNEIDQSMSYQSTLQISTLSCESFDHAIDSLKAEPLHLTRSARNLLAVDNSCSREELPLAENQQNTTFYYVNSNQAAQCQEDLQHLQTSQKDRETNNCLSETFVKTIDSNSTKVLDKETVEPQHEVTKPISKVSKSIANITKPDAGHGGSLEVSQESSEDSASASNTLVETFQDVHFSNTSTHNSNNSQAVVTAELGQTEIQRANDTGEQLLPSVVRFLTHVYNWSL